MFISIASNDYILNYFKNLSSLSTLSLAGCPDSFPMRSSMLAETLCVRCQKTFAEWDIGCVPIIMMRVKREGECVEFLNAAVKLSL
ncbi:hypothetical protein M5689_017003 [Euphorbia peplus]|nr:hypothetical protein M5689_017003 [Euphorbia peplus]